MITVTATRTHRRANRNFERGVPVTIDPDKLSEAESEALLSDPELSIREASQTAKEPDEPALSAEERAAWITAVIPTLGDDDKTRDGAPKVKAVSAAVGFDVSKAEIEAATAALSQSGDGNTGQGEGGSEPPSQ
ncbi:MAG: hypothetical protein AAGH43_06120 [Pseudomonadota bacterium]